MILTWLTARLGIIRWVVWGLSIVTAVWATNRIDSALQAQKDLKVKQAQEDAFRASIERNQAIGAELEKRLSNAKNVARRLSPIGHDASCGFSIERVQSITGYIASVEASRQ